MTLEGSQISGRLSSSIVSFFQVMPKPLDFHPSDIVFDHSTYQYLIINGIKGFLQI